MQAVKVRAGFVSGIPASSLFAHHGLTGRRVSFVNGNQPALVNVLELYREARQGRGVSAAQATEIVGASPAKIVFGPVARGDASPDSDVDLLAAFDYGVLARRRYCPHRKVAGEHKTKMEAHRRLTALGDMN